MTDIEDRKEEVEGYVDSIEFDEPMPLDDALKLTRPAENADD